MSSSERRNEDRSEGLHQEFAEDQEPVDDGGTDSSASDDGDIDDDLDDMDFMLDEIENRIAPLA